MDEYIDKNPWKENLFSHSNCLEIKTSKALKEKTIVKPTCTPMKDKRTVG